MKSNRMRNIHSYPKSSLSPRGEEVGGVLVLAMVKFPKSPKTSKSSLSPVGGGEVGGVLVLTMVKFPKSLKTFRFSLSLMGGWGSGTCNGKIF